MKRRSTTPRSVRKISGLIEAKKSIERDLDAVLTRRTRRVNRLDNALGDARGSGEWSAMWQTTGERSRSDTSSSSLRQPQLPAESGEVAALEQLRDVYDRVEMRNAVTPTRPPFQIPNLSPTQLLAAEQAVQLFVAKMRRIANTQEAQAKTDVSRTLANELSTFGFNSDLGANQHSPEVKNEPPIDDVASWYVMGKEIGRGTFGRVRLGTHRLSGTSVAIKSYARLQGTKTCLPVVSIGKRTVVDSGSDALEWRRVRQEVKVLSRLQAHPNIVRFIEFFESLTRIHAVTEFVRGSSLCDVLRRTAGQRLAENRAKAIFQQLVMAVEALHTQGVIHRDLKLENVLLDERSGHATVIDFGFSDFEEIVDRPMPDGADPKTRTKKNFCGTPSYMAPEVVACACYDGRPVDVWSLGVLLYVMLCGKFPFQSTNFHQLYQKLRSGTQQLILPPVLSSGARALLQALLVVDPTKRPSAGALRCHIWLQDVEDPRNPSQQTRNTLDSAFSAWSGTRQGVCMALLELYDLSLNPSELERLLLAQRGRRRCRLDAFLELAGLVCCRQLQRTVETPFASSIQALAASRQQQEAEIDEADAQEPADRQDVSERSSTQHKQQLEKLIGLVKLSLAVAI
ncbi:hypothetical protein BBJ28_00004763 [Nothophytophthora sp. Chile5]|nr:hypothetical protein BBJ28_00004763 [Nothophytophthora sp. Chile5]